MPQHEHVTDPHDTLLEEMMEERLRELLNLPPEEPEEDPWPSP